MNIENNFPGASHICTKKQRKLINPLDETKFKCGDEKCFWNNRNLFFCIPWGTIVWISGVI